jgi:ferredoxin-thioredoxin reductase catalytic subunit
VTDEVGQLKETLRPLQEKRGYFFNADQGAVEELLESLLVNKSRYGYMSCPCRLASGEREKDRDIVCPCRYREADVAEYGACYCGLYVSRAWNEGTVPRRRVPERRPPDLVR